MNDADLTTSESGRPVVAETLAEIRATVAAARGAGRTIGFVPTMGALHAGHVSLIERARTECDFVVVSIFVNPTQFGPGEDFQRYPRPRELDLQICGNAGADVVFYPGADAMYPPGFRTYVEVQGLSGILEGAIRPGHFRGVTTVVAKLFMIVAANRAFFGQKDYQQQLLIRTMVRELNLPIEIVTCPTMRDVDGLAMSSRNAYLAPDDRQRGLVLSKSLFLAEKMVQSGERDVATIHRRMCDLMTSTAGVTVDYGVIVDAETLTSLTDVVPEMVALVAARVGTTRLIDNVILRSE